MTHDEIGELLAAYALDAVDGAEADEIEAHLTGCPRCRAEVARYRETAAVLAYAGGTAPERLWERIAAGLDEGPPPLAPPVPFVARDVPVDGRWRRLNARLLAAAAVVISVVALGIAVTRDTGRSSRSDGPADLASAVADPSAVRVRLVSAAGGETAEIVVVRGRAWLATDTLPPLPEGETYQLWGVKGAVTVSLAVLGPNPDVQRFPVGSEYEAMAITAEKAPGVVASNNPAIVVGRVPPS